jgi:hypothetical protein
VKADLVIFEKKLKSEGWLLQIEATKWPPICVAPPWWLPSNEHDGQCRAAKSVWQLSDSPAVVTIFAWRLPWGCWLSLAAIVMATTVVVDLLAAIDRHGSLFMFGSHSDGGPMVAAKFVWQASHGCKLP